MNLAHVARVTTQITHSGEEHHTLYSADDTALGVTDDPDFDPNRLAAPVVPAAFGTTIVVVKEPDLNRDQRPTDGDLWTEELPVLAWRLMPYGADPIVAWQEDLHACKIFHRAPGGAIYCPGDCTFPTLEEAIAGTLRDAQFAWDLRHPAPLNAAT